MNIKNVNLWDCSQMLFSINKAKQNNNNNDFT